MNSFRRQVFIMTGVRTMSPMLRNPVLLLLLAIASPWAALAESGEGMGATLPQREDGWGTVAPATVGLDRAVLGKMKRAIASGEHGNVHAVLIERTGKLAYEVYFTGKDWIGGRALGDDAFDVDTMHDLRSVSNSVVSTLVGIALAQGHISSDLLHGPVGLPLNIGVMPPNVHKPRRTTQ